MLAGETVSAAIRPRAAVLHYGVLLEVAVQNKTIDEDAKKRILKFRNDPSDESWIG